MEFTTEESTVDLIQSADVDVKTVANVAEVKKIKTRQVNLSTVVTTLKSVTKEELEQATPGVVRDLYVEATRLYTEYKDILAGT